jgi:cell division septation protein DedD
MALQCCPLCRRQLPTSSADHTLDTRLCEQCQTIVLAAFRGADPIVAASGEVVPQGDAIVQVHREASVLDQPPVGAPTFVEDIATVAPRFEQEAQHPTASEPRADLRFEFIEDEDPAVAIGPDLSDVSKNGSSHHGEGLFEEFEQSIRFSEPTPHHDYAEPDESHPAEEPSAFAKADSGSTGATLVEDRSEELSAFTKSDSGSTGATLVEDRSEESRSIGVASPADPWEDPLPAWDYSQSEWPVLVGPNKQKSFRRLGAPIAAIALFACAAGFYLLINRPSGPERRTATDSGRTAQASAVELGATVGASADSDARKRVVATLSEAPASAASQPAETVAREPVTPKESTNAQGRFSLQAAAFPTQVGADEFAEKLKRTGLPSYVVPAELARRGRWFRVRVGRFNAQEEAQRFAGEAQQRARGAGLAVQLIVCQYDQP